MESIDKKKQQLRERALIARQGFADREVMIRSRNITRQLQSSHDWASTQSVHCYLPIKSQNEIDTWRFLAWLWVDYPAVKTYSPFGDRLDIAVKINSGTVFEIKKYDIPTPIGKPMLIDEVAFDVIIVPCLAVSSSTRHRIGYGRGNYDRFLANHKSIAIGLCYKHLACSDLPYTDTDVPLDMIILG